MPKFLIRLAVTLAAMFAFAGCGYQGSYRYECQDPENWNAPQCNPPVCEAAGTCTSDLLPDIETGATIDTPTTTGDTNNG